MKVKLRIQYKDVVREEIANLSGMAHEPLPSWQPLKSMSPP